MLHTVPLFSSHLLWQYSREIRRLGVVPGPHEVNRPDEGDVVRDDLSQLGDVPAVPLPALREIVRPAGIRPAQGGARS